MIHKSLKTKKYTGTIYGQDFESEGCPGKIELSDLKTCKIDHRETLDKCYDGTPDSTLDRLMRSASSTKNKKTSVNKYKRYGIRVGFNFVDGEDMVFYDCSSSTSPYAMNFFQDKGKFKVSPKQLGACKTLKAIEKKLIDVVVDFDGKNERKICEPMDMRPDLSAIKSIEDIESIFISYKGWDKDESDDFYEATYTYYMDGSFYCGEILNPQYADKVDKVLLELSDLDACEVEETDIANDEDGDEEVEELVKQVTKTPTKGVQQTKKVGLTEEEKKQKKALDLYYDLLTLKEPPMRILFLIARQFNMLLQVKELRQKGADNRQIGEKVGLPPFIAGKYVTQAAGFSREELRRAIEECVAAEEAVKTGRMNDVMSVEILIVKYSAKK